MAKYDSVFCVLDTETGGLPSLEKKKATKEVALTELAMVIVDNVSLEIIDKKSWLFKPNYVKDLIYRQQALDVSHITLDMLQKDGLEMKTAFQDIEAFVLKHSKSKNKPYLVGHNLINFDLEFIVNLWDLNGKDAEKYFNSTMFDTMEFARLKYVELTNFKLGTIVAENKIDIVEAHRALNDTIATAEVWIKFVKCLRSQGEQKEKRFRDTFKFEF